MDSFSFFLLLGMGLVMYMTIKVFFNNAYANFYLVGMVVVFILIGGLKIGAIQIGPQLTDTTPEAQLYHSNNTRYNELYLNITSNHTSNYVAPNLSSYNPYSKLNLSIDSSIDMGDILE
jgi:hypothetical protein